MTERRMRTPRTFMKRPQRVEAIKWTGDNLQEVIKFTGRHPSATHLSWEDYETLVREQGLKIFTLEGPLRAKVGDWIIQGLVGEFYPCDEKVFNLTYQIAAPTEDPNDGVNEI